LRAFADAHADGIAPTLEAQKVHRIRHPLDLLALS